MTKYGDIKSIFYYCFQLPSSCRLAFFSILYRIYGLYDRPDPCRGGCLAGAQCRVPALRRRLLAACTKCTSWRCARTSCHRGRWWSLSRRTAAFPLKSYNRQYSVFCLPSWPHQQCRQLAVRIPGSLGGHCPQWIARTVCRLLPSGRPYLRPGSLGRQQNPSPSIPL